MADNDDDDDDTPDNVVPFGRAAVKSSPTQNMDAETLVALLKKYDTIAVVGWSDEMEALDVISAEPDMAVLYELLQQAASNIALEALDNASASTFH